MGVWAGVGDGWMDWIGMGLRDWGLVPVRYWDWWS